MLSDKKTLPIRVIAVITFIDALSVTIRAIMAIAATNQLAGERVIQYTAGNVFAAYILVSTLRQGVKE